MPQVVTYHSFERVIAGLIRCCKREAWMSAFLDALLKRTPLALIVVGILRC
jgi:hypothetical protein